MDESARKRTIVVYFHLLSFMFVGPRQEVDECRDLSSVHAEIDRKVATTKSFAGQATGKMRSMENEHEKSPRTKVNEQLNEHGRT
jgi:hypothetical protein